MKKPAKPKPRAPRSPRRSSTSKHKTLHASPTTTSVTGGPDSDYVESVIDSLRAAECLVCQHNIRAAEDAYWIAFLRAHAPSPVCNGGCLADRPEVLWHAKIERNLAYASARFACPYVDDRGAYCPAHSPMDPPFVKTPVFMEP